MSVTFTPYTLPLRAPLGTAWGQLRERAGFVVRLKGARATGLGEAAPLPPWTEDLGACEAALREAQRAGWAGEPLKALERLEHAVPRLAQAPAARHAVASALLDLAGQEAGESMAAVLGARLGRAPRLGRLPLNAVVGAMEPEASARIAREAVLMGYGAVKLKLAGPWALDEARVRAAREALGGSELRVDANASWAREDAPAKVGVLAALRVAYVEQPLAAGDLEGMAALRGHGVGIAADEAASSLPGALRVLAERAADVVIVKPMALGGPDRAAELLRRCELAGVRCVVTSLLDGALARAAAAHVAALLPDPVPACGLDGQHLARDLADLGARAGHLELRRKPGLGVEGLRLG